MLRKIKNTTLNTIRGIQVKNKTKIFCIGRNKTGTTSLGNEFKLLGYVVGNQHQAEKLVPFYKKNNFEPIIKYCHSAQVFQDFPFSFPNTYKYLDKAFPNSKFILSIRDSPEEWYQSLTRYHAKIFGNGSIPTAKQLKEAEYVWKGWIWECNRINYPTPESNPYQKDLVLETYKQYNKGVLEYFKDRPKDLLVINLKEEEAYKKFCDFLELDSPRKQFPWKNKT